jgi:hypothetical protein
MRARSSIPSPEFQSWWDSFRDTGDICPIRLGMSREEIRAILGQPDDVGVTSRKWRTPAIYKYGDVEFHFGLGPQGTLILIYRERDGIAQISISQARE